MGINTGLYDPDKVNRRLLKRGNMMASSTMPTDVTGILFEKKSAKVSLGLNNETPWFVKINLGFVKIA